MHVYNLDTFLAGHVFAFMLLLCRLGGVMMLFPGIGEHYVPQRMRMVFTCLICLLLLEPMMPRLPPLPPSLGELARIVGYEIVIGLFFGTLVRLIFSTLESTGMIIGISTGLSNATMLNPAQATQSGLPGAFLSTAGLAMIFITGLDHFMIRSAVALYDAFPAGGSLMPGDMAQTVIKGVNESFAVGVQMAASFLIMGLLLYTALGILQRIMPSIQIFMVAMPLEIWGGLALFSLTVVGILTFWLNFFDRSLGNLFQG